MNLVNMANIKKQALAIMRDINPTIQFLASNGWFQIFLSIYKLRGRAVTHVAQCLREKYMESIAEYLMQIKR